MSFTQQPEIIHNTSTRISKKKKKTGDQAKTDTHVPRNTDAERLTLRPSDIPAMLLDSIGKGKQSFVPVAEEGFLKTTEGGVAEQGRQYGNACLVQRAGMLLGQVEP